MFLGAVITGLGFLSLSFVNTPAHFYVSYIFVGVGLAAMGQVPSTAVITHWFLEKRGLAVGLTSMGVGIGGLIVAPLVGGFIIPSFGWRIAYLSLAFLSCVIVIPLVCFVIKPGPFVPHSDSAENGQIGIREEPLRPGSSFTEFSLKRHLMSAPLWLMSIAFLLSQFSITGSLQSQVPHLEDIGFSVATAVTALGGVGLVSSFSKFFFGWICDFIKVKQAFLLAILFQAAGTFILMSILPTSHIALLWLYIVVIGLGGGSWLPIMSMFVSTYFDPRAYGTLFGIANFALYIGVATGPLMAGYIYDIKGAYRPAFLIFMGIYALAVLTVLPVRKSDKK
jgi:MFS family permease